MANRLDTQIELSDRVAGEYDGVALGGVAIPVGDNRVTIRIRRPNTLLGEKAWPTIEPSKEEPAAVSATLDRKTSMTAGGLDTEVLRAYCWLSLDAGSTWQPFGHVGTPGGDIYDQRGDLMLETTLIADLPEPNNANRRIFITIKLLAPLETKVEIDTEQVVINPTTKFDTHRSIALEGSSNATKVTAGTSVTTSGNVPVTGSNRLCIAMAGAASSGSGNYTSFVFNSVTMTQKFTHRFSTYFSIHCATLSDASFPGSAGTVTFTMSASQSGMAIWAGTYSGVDQTTPTDDAPTVSTGGATLPSHTVTAGDTGDIRIACMYGADWEEGSDEPYVGSGETQVYNTGPYHGYGQAFAVSVKTDGGSDAMDWTPAANFGWGMRGFNINIASGAPPSVAIPIFLKQYRARRI